MRWKGRRGSDNVEDRRGRGKAVALGGGGGLVLVIVIAGAIFGFNPQKIVNFLNQFQGQGNPGQQAAGPRDKQLDDEAAQFVSVVLADTEDVWSEQFRLQGVGQRYVKPVLVLYDSDVVDTGGCGRAPSGVGPFYCPADKKIYINLEFYDQLANEHRAPGDFAQAYVIAHEVGHHIQNLLGTSGQVSAQRGKVSETAYNRLSVRLELQADFLAGVWAYHAQQRFEILEAGDLEEAINAASQIGDDTLQKKSQGYVVPERYTHGTSRQRVKWFRKGFESGKVRDGNQLFTLAYDSL